MFEQKDFSFIHKYFIAEKQGSLFLIAVGIAAILLAIIFFVLIKNNSSIYKGAAIALMTIGFIQSIVGFNVYSRTDKQKSDIAYNVGLEPVTYTKNTELPRVTKMLKGFIIYKWVEIACIVCGIVLIFVYRTDTDKSFWVGFGIALALQAIILLSVDYFAEKRAGNYKNQLEKITLQNKS